MFASKRVLPALARNVRLYSTPTEPPVMHEVREALKSAMRAKDEARKVAIRSVMSVIKTTNLEKPGSIVTDIGYYNTVQSMIKKHKNVASEFAEADRQDLVDKENHQIAVLEELAKQVAIADEKEIESRLLDLAKEKGIEVDNKKFMSAIPWKSIEKEWNAPSKSVVDAVKRLSQQQKRSFHTSARRMHENPLGLPRQKPTPKFRPGQKVVTRKPIKGVKKIIAVSSAKGGVGKSTIAVNTALGLYNEGLNVGILDVDVFGPSIPKLLKLEGEPEITAEGFLIPKQNYGLKAMSMGFMVDPAKAVAWRGLLVQKALEQMLFEVEWGQLDVLVLDMPPGTGDVQLTLAQQVQIDGAVVVSTPQDIALIDAIRGIQMFKTISTPILGMVQNMSYFVCPNCDHETHIFGHDGALKEAAKQEINILGSVPLNGQICTDSDAGKPPAAIPGSDYAKPYSEIACNVKAALGL